MVVNVEVEVVTDMSVRVSWDLLDSPEITGYMVYYSLIGIGMKEQFVNVISSTNSVVIGDNVEYQFQVAAIAELDGDVIIGERSTLNNMSVVALTITPTTQPSSPTSPTPSSHGIAS